MTIDKPFTLDTMRKERILIVDDEQDVVDLLRYNLEKADYETIVALNGLDAVEFARIRKPDLVLLDVMLPELDGWEVCRTLRSSPHGKSLPVIMLSALSEEQARIKGLSEGADDYLTKPFSLQELQIKIRKHLDRSRTIQALCDRDRDNDTSLKYLIHELKNSLSVIGNFTSLALRKENGDRRYIKTINSVTLHAENLLNDASLLVRLESGNGSLSVSAVDAESVLSDVVLECRQEAAKREIEIIIENSGAPLICGHRIAVRQVIVNLLSNAIKYNRQGGKVWLSLREADSRVEMTVRDEGHGMPADELPRIFEKFYRGTGSERLKGAGLGLYIVRLLTHAMGATITAASTAGVGSVFTLSFQIHVEQTTASAVAPHPLIAGNAT
ncbi:MAG TPA: hybrid sensor histidine kinase/response regulator [Nitrospirota bacterium]|nr:hybrid sensor histidine kinase/response regulator [Nitrospirota bacterium]